MAIEQPDGYLALPDDGAGDGVLVLHAWWGLNETLRAFCDRLAAEGFVTFAPDLYHGQIARTIPEAEALGGALDSRFDEAVAEVAAAARYLRERAGGKLAVVGFSLGVYYALNLAAADPDTIAAVVIFYGSGDADYSTSRAAYLGHFAENDAYEPREGVDALEESLRSAGRPVAFHHYPGTGHWFFEPDVTDAYDEAAAKLAWERTVAFLKENASRS